MKSQDGINNRWGLLEGIVGVSDLKRKFNPWHWYEDANITISKQENWSGWWNDCFDFVSIFPKTAKGKAMLDKIAQEFANHGYKICTGLIRNGISIHYETMSQQELDENSRHNFLNGGRMSD